MRKTVEEIIDTIKALKGFTRDYEVADSLGVGRGALSNAKQRDSISFIDELVTFCEREGMTLDFIRQVPSPVEALWMLAPAYHESEDAGRYVRADVYSISGRPGGDPSSFDAVDSVLLPRELCREGCMVIRVNGDSMEKLLMDGAKAVIDTHTKDIVSGSLYAFQIPHEGSIVRECHSQPGGLSLIPYNKNYPASSIRWEDFDPGMVIGKVSCSVVNVFR